MKIKCTSMSVLILIFHFAVLSCTVSSSSSVTGDGGRRTYIVHMDANAMPDAFSSRESWHASIVSSIASSAGGGGESPTHLYTYKHVIQGFSAVLSDAQLEHLKNMPGHVAATPSTYAKLHTTHTPRFLHLNRHAGLWPASNFGDDMIIGIIDTGVWPESASFDDKGMPPVPARWKGTCEEGVRFNTTNCNRKLIGARSFSKAVKYSGQNISTVNDYDSPRDFFGHGTHTSSTAAGARVVGAEHFEYAKGNAIGIAPSARVAMYKVLFSIESLLAAAADVLAGMDQAIEDGVDLMSISLGFVDLMELYENIIAIGAFAAMERGIFVSVSAGNAGIQGYYSVINGAPWFTSVGAGTIDRDYVATIALGNGTTTIQANTLYPEGLFVAGVALYYGFGNNATERCYISSLNPKDVAGKIVLCSYEADDDDPWGKMATVANSTALAAIIISDNWHLMRAIDFVTPAVIISPKDGEVVIEYLRNTATNATVDITFQQTILGTRAPQVAAFSSRGPFRSSPGVLKPDVLAPGVNVLAAWARAPMSLLQHIRGNPVMSDYTLLSGTSMASPHVVGVAALLKAAHCDWSPAAIRSAMMTTADITDNSNSPILDGANLNLTATPLDFGAGHINPNRALDPGLIYDARSQDYIDFLCGMNYTAAQISAIIGRTSYVCKPNTDINYPSFIVINDRNATFSGRFFKRILTSVTDGPSTYQAVVVTTKGLNVNVNPKTLHFSGKSSTQEFTMIVEVDQRVSGSAPSYGYLIWTEVGGNHIVRSPIVAAPPP